MANGIFGPTGREVMAQINREAQLRRQQAVRAMGSNDPLMNLAMRGGMQAGDALGELGQTLSGGMDPRLERARKRDQVLQTVQAKQAGSPEELMSSMYQEFMNAGMWQEAYDAGTKLTEMRQAEKEAAAQEALANKYRAQAVKTETEMESPKELEARQSRLQSQKDEAAMARVERAQQGQTTRKGMTAGGRGKAPKTASSKHRVTAGSYLSNIKGFNRKLKDGKNVYSEVEGADDADGAAKLEQRVANRALEISNEKGISVDDATSQYLNSIPQLISEGIIEETPDSDKSWWRDDKNYRMVQVDEGTVTTTPAPDGKIRMKTPKGKEIMVPADKVAEAEDKGASRV